MATAIIVICLSLATLAATWLSADAPQRANMLRYARRILGGTR